MGSVPRVTFEHLMMNGVLIVRFLLNSVIRGERRSRSPRLSVLTLRPLLDVSLVSGNSSRESPQRHDHQTDYV